MYYDIITLLVNYKRFRKLLRLIFPHKRLVIPPKRLVLFPPKRLNSHPNWVYSPSEDVELPSEEGLYPLLKALSSAQTRGLMIKNRLPRSRE